MAKAILNFHFDYLNPSLIPVIPVSPVSPVRLAHLWVDFRVIFLELGDILELFGQSLWFACIYLGVVVQADDFGKSIQLCGPLCLLQ